MLPGKSTTDSRTRVFQYRLLNNVLYFNDQLFKMKLVVTPLCSLCNKFTESAIHFLSECRSTQTLWNKMQHWLHIGLLPLNPQNAMLGFFEAPNSSDLNVTNHILLIFKKALYNKRNCSIIPNIDYIKQKIRLAYQIEKNSYGERHTVQTHKEMGQNFREIVKFGWGGNWHTNYNYVCLWALSGGFRGAHSPFAWGRGSLWVCWGV